MLRRLEKLESTLNVLATEDKWKRIHDRALELISDHDVRILEYISGRSQDDRTAAQTAEQIASLDRFDGACMDAMAEGSIRFTIPEMDQLLAGV